MTMKAYRLYNLDEDRSFLVSFNCFESYSATPTKCKLLIASEH